jgi:hypothetical protein
MIKGPYIIDPDAGLSITETDSTTVPVLAKGLQYSSVEVADATAFPDEDGWLVFGYGYAYQTPPVKYFGLISGTELALDYSFVFPFKIPSGASVTLLKQKGPWVSEEADGYFYLTASTAGRVAASSAIDELAAAGTSIRKEIAYPGDRGLGNEGYPASGSNKLSDKVAVWAGSSVDDEVQAAREEE